ncbi:uncharacterized protein LOC111381114 [Olea europaea var. sylvestris]|uniref:Uncharacterized protein n=1 Tax=Olea europaea subsp. europaea TaxID=158383 RepID=A0A8S0U075_OLEEU|nr:uncharacterized protein LOC111381114 [Olea europaea var. sylvestris]CAA3011697.1 Hypothetical predicted protein [Olea europaea subsp. europaea]
MKSQQSSVRPPGQRSIASTFLFRTSNRVGDFKKNVEIKAPNQTCSRVSLSDFLNQKLHKSSVLPTSVQGKQRPFVSPLSREELKRCAEGESGSKQRGDANVNCSLDGVFEMFKHVEKFKKDNTDSCGNNEMGTIETDELQQTRKRKNQSEGHEDEPSARKRLIILGEDSKAPSRGKKKKISSMDELKPVFNYCHDDEPSARKRIAVLGDDSKPSQRGKRKTFSRKEEHRPLFNHYANGGGWWDSNMEGVDNEEVGCNEVWEGMGSITLGGLEWN